MNRLFIGTCFVIFFSVIGSALDREQEPFADIIDSMQNKSLALSKRRKEKICDALAEAYNGDTLFKSGTNALGAGLVMSAIGFCLDGPGTWRRFSSALECNEAMSTASTPFLKDCFKDVTGMFFTGAGYVATGAGVLLLIHYGIEQIINDDLELDLETTRFNTQLEKERGTVIRLSRDSSQ